jgi:Flp pilus assembly protein TadG
MALLCPFLAFMMVVAIDYCRVFHLTQTVESSAQNAALYAAGVSTSDPDNFASQMAAAQQAALDEGSRLSPPLTAANVSVSVNNNIATATVTHTFSTITRIPGLPSTMTVTRTVNVPVLPKNPGYVYGAGTNAGTGNGIDITVGAGGGGISVGVGGGGITIGGITLGGGLSNLGSSSNSGSNSHSGCGLGCCNNGRQCDPCD